MTAATNKPLIAAALGQPTDRRPCWFMRQAGRYLPEYREIRADIDFVSLCKNPKMAAEVTLQPLRRFDLDGAIIFSDILTTPMALGQTLTFDKGHGPQLAPVIRTAEDVANLRQASAKDDLHYVGDALAATKSGLKPEQALLGFAGAPFTVASYMIEGSGSKNYTEVKRMAFNQPQVLTDLLDRLADLTIDYLAMQIEAGADAVMIFDSWAGQLTPGDYVRFALPPVQKIARELKAMKPNPIIYFPGQGGDRMKLLRGLQVDVIQVDWRQTMTLAATNLRRAGLDVTLQGNLDPQSFLGDESVVRERVQAVLDDVEAASPRAHIFNVGHGLLPHTPPEALGWAIDELRKQTN